MKHLQLILLFVLPATSWGQSLKKVSVCADFHVNKTIYDRTPTNNAGGFGGGLQVFLNTKSGINPTIEATSDAFGGTKELYVTSDGRPIYSKDAVGSILGGVSLKVSTRSYFTIAAGPSFFNWKSYLTVKPALAIRFPDNQRFVFKIAFMHVFQHDDISSKPFGYLNFGLGIRFI